MSKLERKMEVLKEVQVAMKIHGIGNSNSILAQKVLCILLAIASFFYFIRLIGNVPGIAIIYMLLGIDSISFYSVQWDRAHKIPSLMNGLKACTHRKRQRFQQRQRQIFGHSDLNRCRCRCENRSNDFIPFHIESGAI